MVCNMGPGQTDFFWALSSYLFSSSSCQCMVLTLTNALLSIGHFLSVIFLLFICMFMSIEGPSKFTLYTLFKSTFFKRQLS